MFGFVVTFTYNLFNATYSVTVREELKFQESKFFMKYLLSLPGKQEMGPPFSLKNIYEAVSKLCFLTIIFIIWMPCWLFCESRDSLIALSECLCFRNIHAAQGVTGIMT